MRRFSLFLLVCLQSILERASSKSGGADKNITESSEILPTARSQGSRLLDSRRIASNAHKLGLRYRWFPEMEPTGHDRQDLLLRPDQKDESLPLFLAKSKFAPHLLERHKWRHYTGESVREEPSPNNGDSLRHASNDAAENTHHTGHIDQGSNNFIADDQGTLSSPRAHRSPQRVFSADLCQTSA